MVVPDLTALQSVGHVLGTYDRGDLVSSHQAIASIHEKLPDLGHLSDDLLTALIVAATTRKGISVRFDHELPDNDG